MLSAARSLFVVGTDTGVGKTLVACALLHALAAQGKKVIGMKPVAAGLEDGHWRDSEALQAASNCSAPAALVAPYAFEAPVSPHIAAREQSQVIDLKVIFEAHQALLQHAERVVVEGAGGLMVPLGDGPASASNTGGSALTGLDLLLALQIPVVLVVGMRLGCLNHALLTQRVLQASGVPCLGWVANCVDPQMAQREANIASLVRWLQSPHLGTLAWQPGQGGQPDPAALARELRLALLPEAWRA